MPAGRAASLGRAVKRAGKRYIDWADEPIHGPNAESFGAVESIARNPMLHAITAGAAVPKLAEGIGNVGKLLGQVNQQEPVTPQSLGSMVGDIGVTGAAQAANYLGVPTALRGIGAGAQYLQDNFVPNTPQGGGAFGLSPLTSAGRLGDAIEAKATRGLEGPSRADAEPTQGTGVEMPPVMFPGAQMTAVLNAVGKPLKGARRVFFRSVTSEDMSTPFHDPDSISHPAFKPLVKMFRKAAKEKRPLGETRAFVDDPSWRRVIDGTTGVERKSGYGGGRLYDRAGNEIPNVVVEDAMTTVFPSREVKMNLGVTQKGKKELLDVDVTFYVEPHTRNVTLSSMSESGRGIGNQVSGATNKLGTRPLIELVQRVAKEFPEADIMQYMRVGGRIGKARTGKVPLHGSPPTWKKVNLKGIREGKTQRDELFKFQGGTHRGFGDEVRSP